MIKIALVLFLFLLLESVLYLYENNLDWNLFDHIVCLCQSGTLMWDKIDKKKVAT